MASAEVRWIKIVTDIFDDEKIQLIESLPEADTILVCWFKMLCLAGKQNNHGMLMVSDRIPYTDEMLATIFHRPLNIVRIALATFERYGMIEIINNTVTIPNWDKHQTLDALEKARNATRKRVAEYRERNRQKLLGEGNETENNGCNVTVTSRNGDVTPTDIDRDIESINDIDISEETPLTAVFRQYQIAMTPHSWDLLRGFMEDGIPVSLIKWVCNDAVERGAPNWKYINEVLNSCVTQNIKTVEQAEKAAEEHRKRKQAKQSTQKPTVAINPLDRVGFTT